MDANKSLLDRHFKVDYAKQRGKADATRDAIFTCKEIPIESTLMLVAQAVPAPAVLAAISTEMLASYQQAVLQMSVVRHEKLLHKMEQSAAQGLLTTEELAEAKRLQHNFITPASNNKGGAD